MQKIFRLKREAHGKKATKGGLDYVEVSSSSNCSAKLFYGWTYPDLNDMKKAGYCKLDLDTKYIPSL